MNSEFIVALTALIGAAVSIAWKARDWLKSRRRALLDDALIPEERSLKAIASTERAVVILEGALDRADRRIILLEEEAAKLRVQNQEKDNIIHELRQQVDDLQERLQRMEARLNGVKE